MPGHVPMPGGRCFYSCTADRVAEICRHPAAPPRPIPGRRKPGVTPGVPHDKRGMTRRINSALPSASAGGCPVARTSRGGGSRSVTSHGISPSPPQRGQMPPSLRVRARRTTQSRLHGRHAHVMRHFAIGQHTSGCTTVGSVRRGSLPRRRTPEPYFDRSWLDSDPWWTLQGRVGGACGDTSGPWCCPPVQLGGRASAVGASARAWSCGAPLKHVTRRGKPAVRRPDARILADRCELPRRVHLDW